MLFQSKDELINLSVAVSSAGVASWAWLSNAPEFLIVIFSLITGTFLNEFVQSRREGKIHRREANLRVMSEIYTRLYRDLGNILQTGMKGTMAWRAYDTRTWDEIRNDPFSLMIPQNLEKKVDALYGLANTVNERANKVTTIVSRKLTDTIRERLGQDIHSFNIQIYGVTDRRPSKLPLDILPGLVRGNDPLAEAKTLYPADSYQMTFEVVRGDSQSFQAEHVSSSVLFDIFEKTIKDIGEDPEVEAMKADELVLAGTCAGLRTELGQLIKNAVLK